MPDIFTAIQNGLPELSLAGLFFAFFFGTFLSEDAACLLAGSAAANGRVSFAFAVATCFAGIFAGDLLLYAAGRVFGKRIFDLRIVKRFVSERTVGKAAAWLEKNGATAVFISRFVSGLRLPTYLLAGALRTNFIRFMFYFLIASAIWTPILVGSVAFSQTYLFTENWLTGMIVLAIMSKVIFNYSSWKKRRLLVGRLKRVRRWEFWPIQIFYAPVVIYIFLLGIKHRSLTAFTAANPAMPAGGFKGESKDQIYRGLNLSEDAADHLLRYTLLPKHLPVNEKLSRTWRFIEQNGLTFPIVLKPDVGERGKGVRIVRSEDELEAEILTADVDQILQEFSVGIEVSIFYYRLPREGRGQIFSVTEKCFPELVGDGIATLEELILKDSRAVCLAGKYFEENQKRLTDVPLAGEAIRLVDIGTHSRGAIFLDGGHLKTEALERKIDEICSAYRGFYFGRFDIRTRSTADLQRGEFKIIELNGVTSESTNIYDPRYSLLDAYRILFRQWRAAFEIGSMNIKLGARPTKVVDLIRLALGRMVRAPESPVCTQVVDAKG